MACGVHTLVQNADYVDKAILVYPKKKQMRADEHLEIPFPNIVGSPSMPCSVRKILTGSPNSSNIVIGLSGAPSLC
ncbi:hypothetical protein S101446_01765 [Komagataeibacter europaeus]|nr:hypothetical protein S101446_01765 [Komagataeibacter europaeus]